MMGPRQSVELIPAECWQLLRGVSVDRYGRALVPWAAGTMDQVITIAPQTLTGIRLVGWCG